MAGYWTDLKRADKALRAGARKAEVDLLAAYDRFEAAGGTETGCCVDCSEPEVARRYAEVGHRFKATFGYWPF
jgi:hypothetical protein